MFDPFEDNGFDDMIRQFFGEEFVPSRKEMHKVRRYADEYIEPTLDVVEDEKAVYTIADIPGIKKSDLKWEFEDGKLTIKGKFSEQLVNQNGEKGYLKSIDLNKKLKVVEESYINGILEIKFEKKNIGEQIKEKFSKKK